ncbi:MAG: bifunctional metallophosphatase/5'-nucleotidase, partial [Saprospiraceae bacterium]
MGEMNGPGGSAEPAFPPDEQFSTEIHFTILQLNDVYEIAPLEQGKVGGMARVSSLRKQLMLENANVLTVLAGDFLNPSLIGTLKYEGERIKGRQMVEVMNELGVDVVAFGNHEFDVKENELQSRIDESFFEWLGTNVLHQTGRKIEPFYKESYGFRYFLPETHVWEIFDYNTGNVVKVGFFSACINDNNPDYTYFEDPFGEARKAYLELQNEADVIVGLTHLERPMDLKLAAMLPKTALIMGGHEHDHSIDTIGNVVITKADANAKTVYVHRFTYYTDTKELTLESELVPITDEIPEEPNVAAVVAKWNQIQRDKISEVVANPEEVIFNATTPLDGREKSIRNKQTNLGEIIGASMARAARQPVDCAFFNGGSVRLDDQLSGEITVVDIFRTLPFGGGLYEIQLKGKILKKALDAGIENKGVGGYLQWYNIEYNEEKRSWKIGGKPLSEGKIYRIITSDYLARGKETKLEFFNPRNFIKWETAKDGDTQDLRSDVRKAIVSFLKSTHE